MHYNDDKMMACWPTSDLSQLLEIETPAHLAPI